MTSMISMRGVCKNFGTQAALTDFNLEVQRSEIVTLIGPSGSGKTTALRCMNFLETHDVGEVYIKGARLGYFEDATGRRLRDTERNIAGVLSPLAMVFQQFNLWPHMTALENVMAPLVLGRRMLKDKARGIAAIALERVGLSHRADHHPAHLSGGQQQRVGIARALAIQPEVLLLDEPTSALDPELADEVLEIIQALAREGMTMVMVTHEMSFAADISSRVIFMEAGKIIEAGQPRAIFETPTSERLRNFLAPWKRRGLAVHASRDKTGEAT